MIFRSFNGVYRLHSFGSFSIYINSTIWPLSPMHCFPAAHEEFSKDTEIHYERKRNRALERRVLLSEMM